MVPVVSRGITATGQGLVRLGRTDGAASRGSSLGKFEGLCRGIDGEESTLVGLGVADQGRDIVGTQQGVGEYLGRGEGEIVDGAGGEGDLLQMAGEQGHG